MSTKREKNELVDKCFRWDLRRCYGSIVASWTIEDQDSDKLYTPYPDFNPSDILERTADERTLSPGTPTTETLEMFQSTTST